MIGAIADDFTGGTDVAVAFRRHGLRTAIVFGTPDPEVSMTDYDVVVVALKTRTVAPDNAVTQSVAAARWLRDQGARQLYFKFCSTFDSRPEGNIGPVADALVELSRTDLVAVVPSSPEHGRTQYLGHLFVHSQLLSDSPMRDHPLTPMTDSRVAELLEPQTSGVVQLVPHDVVRAGAESIANRFDALRADGVRYAVVDAIDDSDLSEIGTALQHAPLITGAAGLAGGLARAITRSGTALRGIEQDPVGPGPSVVLAGSCSAMTLEQIDRYKRRHPSFFMDVLRSQDPGLLAREAEMFLDRCIPGSSPLIYSSVPPERLRHIQEELGTDTASSILEDAIGQVANIVRARGIRRIIAAGGETSGAVTTVLNVRRGLIGSEQAPGVPWIFTDDGMALLLKSGNFGDPDMLVDAVAAHSTQRT